MASTFCQSTRRRARRWWSGVGADGVEQCVHISEGEAEFGGVSLEDFLVFVEEVIAEDCAPAILAQSHEDLERLSEPGAKRRIENIRYP